MLYLVYVAYVAVVLLLRWQWDMGMAWFVVGCFMGLWFVYLARIINVYLVSPQTHLSEHVRHLVAQRRIKDALELLHDRGHEQQRLTVRSIFFMGAWVPVALFVMTSTGNWLATGLVMGIGLNMVHDLWKDYRHLDRLRQWLFWPIGRPVKDGEVRGVAVLFTVLFVGLSLALV